MKNILIIIAAALFGVAILNGAETPALSLTERAHALYTLHNQALSGKKTAAAKTLAQQALVTAQADEINTLTAAIDQIPDYAGFVAMYKGYLDNGVSDAGTWTLSVPLVQQYCPSMYIAHAAPLEEVQAYVATPKCSIGAVQSASKRLSAPELLAQAYALRVGTGETAVSYQRWFKASLSSLTPAAKLAAVVSELNAVAEKAAVTDASTGWKIELTQLQAIYARQVNQ